VTRIKVSTVIGAPPERVWDDVRDLASHVEWMADAEAIRFTSARESGVGTTFLCDTKVGPFRLVDDMEVTEWVDGSVIGVRHVGLVTGTGRFTLAPTGFFGRRTRFTWEEEIGVPAVAGVVLRLIWWRNLRRLRKRF
jgi:uncharacterized protein YndB with AHSA1/START domain